MLKDIAKNQVGVRRDIKIPNVCNKEFLVFDTKVKALDIRLVNLHAIHRDFRKQLSVCSASHTHVKDTVIWA